MSVRGHHVDPQTVNRAGLASHRAMLQGRMAAACADLNADGAIDGTDLAILLGAWTG